MQSEREKCVGVIRLCNERIYSMRKEKERETEGGRWSQRTTIAPMSSHVQISAAQTVYNEAA